MQHNIAKFILIIYSCFELAFKSNIDFILIQKPWIANDNQSIISYSAYQNILPINQNIRLKVAIYIRKTFLYKYYIRPDIITDPDIIILDISGPGIKIQIINIYNERSLISDNDDWIIKRNL